MFTRQHPETQLIAYLRGELSERDHRRVADHLPACPECALAVEEFRKILQDLATSAPKPPAIQWGAYRAELKAKLESRRAPSWGWQWLRRPLSVALSAALVGALLIFAFQSGNHRLPAELAFLEETAVTSRLDFLSRYSVLERLDLLEDLDVIRHLDQIPARREG